VPVLEGTRRNEWGRLKVLFLPLGQAGETLRGKGTIREFPKKKIAAHLINICPKKKCRRRKGTTMPSDVVFPWSFGRKHNNAKRCDFPI